jgi:hypothetical protein
MFTIVYQENEEKEEMVRRFPIMFRTRRLSEWHRTRQSREKGVVEGQGKAQSDLAGLLHARNCPCGQGSHAIHVGGSHSLTQSAAVIARMRIRSRVRGRETASR